MYRDPILEDEPWYMRHFFPIMFAFIGVCWLLEKFGWL